MPHKRKPATVADKFPKRLAISQASFIREAEGVPCDPRLAQPFPVPRTWVEAFANPYSFSSPSGEPPLEPHPEQLGGHAGDSQGVSPDIDEKDEPAVDAPSVTELNATIGDGSAVATTDGCDNGRHNSIANHSRDDDWA